MVWPFWRRSALASQPRAIRVNDEHTRSPLRAAQVTVPLEPSIALPQDAGVVRSASLVFMARRCIIALTAGSKIFVCGDRGSAGDDQHLTAELLIKLSPEFKRDGLTALPLALEQSTLRACGNDDGLESTLKSLGRRGDVLVAITTAGESQNVICALKAAREMGITVLGLFGGDSGPALQSCDSAILTMSQCAGDGQERQKAIGRALMELIEGGLLERAQTGQLTR